MPHKILTLKDRPEYAVALKDLIEPHGYKVLIVHTIEEAYETLHREAVNMVIIAVHLQDGNVFDFLRTVRADPNQLSINYRLYVSISIQDCTLVFSMKVWRFLQKLWAQTNLSLCSHTMLQPFGHRSSRCCPKRILVKVLI